MLFLQLPISVLPQHGIFVAFISIRLISLQCNNINLILTNIFQPVEYSHRHPQTTPVTRQQTGGRSNCCSLISKLDLAIATFHLDTESVPNTKDCTIGSWINNTSINVWFVEKVAQ